MKTTDELLAILAKLKGEPTPEYVYDECGIAAKAIGLREWKRRCEWYEELNDELPEHSAPPQPKPKEKPK